jgi:hypothetical protein
MDDSQSNYPLPICYNLTCNMANNVHNNLWLVKMWKKSSQLKIFVTLNQLKVCRNDLWCQKWSVMSEMICDVRNDLWCQKWSVMSEMICDVRNDLWCQKRYVMSEMICDVRNDLWCQKRYVMSEMICDVNFSSLYGIVCFSFYLIMIWYPITTIDPIMPPLV